MSFVIVTDSGANLTPEQYREYDVSVVSLTYSVGDKEFLSYEDGKAADYKGFYDLLRSKEHVKTSLVSYERVENALIPALEEGKDVLYLSFSSALSGSCQVAKNCAEELSEKYPDRKIIVVDTLQASMGEGLFVKLAAEKRAEGLSITETANYLEKIKLNVVALFTVDDLFFLKRGGRLSGTVAVVGTILGIKPMLHVSDEGKLVNTDKVRGRDKSITELAAKMGEQGENLSEQDIFISHGDCIEDAEKLAEIIRREYGVKSITINYVDQVIGSHSGPGTLALFFIGKKR